MSKSRLTLIIDGNWLLMSRISVLNNRYASDIELCRELQLLMVKSINVVLRTFPIIDNVIFVSDGGSWRNNVEIPKFLKNEDGTEIEYKGKRVKQEGIDWDLVFNEYENFIKMLESSGITTCKERHIEGDDWCWYWSNKLNSEGTNTIIWSKDKDLTQLVNNDKNSCFTICWNKDNVTVKDVNEEEMDFLFNSSYNTNKELYNYIINKCKTINKINPTDVVIDKIIRGDKGDNIIPIILRKSKNGNDKVYRVSTKDIDLGLNIHSDKDIESYIRNLLNTKSYIGRVDKSPEEIIEHFKYNRTMVTLEKESYPESILNALNSHDEYNINKDFSIIESQLNASSNGITNILDLI